jgi:hypothetical protein
VRRWAAALRANAVSLPAVIAPNRVRHASALRSHARLRGADLHVVDHRERSEPPIRDLRPERFAADDGSHHGRVQR